MFASGAETKGLFRREDSREVAWLGGLGTGLPFAAALLFAPLLPLDTVMGPANHRGALLLVIGIAVAVTSIPVISRIFHDLKILHTRFARLILGVAVIEDIVLWGVLAVATGLAVSGPLPAPRIAAHVAAVLVYFVLGLTVFPVLIRMVARASWNVLAMNAPVAFVVAVLFAYTATGTALDVSPVFAAFLAGYAVVTVRGLRRATATLNRVSFAVFVPIYFAVVGYQLDVTRTFSIALVLAVPGDRVHGEAAVSRTRCAAGRVCVARFRQFVDRIERPRRAWNRACHRRLRREDHQWRVLHRALSPGRGDVTGGRRLAGLRRAKGVAAADRSVRIGRRVPAARPRRPERRRVSRSS